MNQIKKIVEEFAAVCEDAQKLTPLSVVKSEVASRVITKDDDYKFLYDLIIDEYIDAVINNGLPTFEYYDLELYKKLIQKYETELQDAVLSRVPTPGSVVVIITNDDHYYIDVLADTIDFGGVNYFIGIRDKISDIYYHSDMPPYEVYRLDYNDRSCSEVIADDTVQIITLLLEIKEKRSIEEIIGARKLEIIEMLNKNKVNLGCLLDEDKVIQGPFYVMRQRI